MYLYSYQKGLRSWHKKGSACLGEVLSCYFVNFKKSSKHETGLYIVNAFGFKTYRKKLTCDKFKLLQTFYLCKTHPNIDINVKKTIKKN